MDLPRDKKEREETPETLEPAGPAEESAGAAGENNGQGDGGSFQRLFWMHLLFDREPVKPDVETIHAAAQEKFGEADIVTSDEKLTSFAIRKYPVVYVDAQVPAQILIAELEDFDQASITPFERSQLWTVRDGDALLSSCTHSLMISDFMAAGLAYKERCELLMDWLETAVELFSDCVAVWIPTAGKLLTRDQILAGPMKGDDRFVYRAVNARFFNIEGTEDSVVDTLGMYAVGLPDVQYHYRGLDPNLVVGHAYNVAAYIFDHDAVIKNGETIDGLDGNGQLCRDIQWRCQYEMALIRPERELMDICPGEFAAGGREQAAEE